MGRLHDLKMTNVDIDKYINPIIPPNRLNLLPRPISRFLGVVPPDAPKREVGSLLIASYSFLGAFCGIMVICATFKYGGALSYANPPTIIASFGASAVLEYGVIASPLGQPRNAMFGHFVSALSGICVTKLFMYSSRFEELSWLAGSIAVGAASALMSLTKTSHPPGGATALLAAIDPQVRGMGWSLLPFVIIASGLMIAVALLINNIQRQFPTHWWTPEKCGSVYGIGKSKKQVDLEAYISQRPGANDAMMSSEGRPSMGQTLNGTDSDEKARDVSPLGRKTTQTSDVPPGSLGGGSEKTLAH